MKRKSVILILLLIGCCAIVAAVAAYSLMKSFNPHVEFLYSKKHVYYVVNRTITDDYGNKTFAISIIENRSGDDPSWSLEKAFSEENFTLESTFETYEYWFGIAGGLNYTQVQMGDIRESVQNVIGEERNDLPINKSLITGQQFPSISYWQGNPFNPSSRGFEKGVTIETTRELDENQIKRLCDILLSYLY
ncbi:MAG: hypothetical protein QXO49_06125 [Candidatus Bathyarchaeia archaeon]